MEHKITEKPLGNKIYPKVRCFLIFHNRIKTPEKLAK